MNRRAAAELKVRFVDGGPVLLTDRRVFAVARNADHRPLIAILAAKTNAPADRVYPAECFSRHCFVENHYPLRTLDVPAVKLATIKDVDSHRLKVIGTYRVPCVLDPGPFHRDIGKNDLRSREEMIVERHDSGGGRRGNARHRAKLLDRRSRHCLNLCSGWITFGNDSYLRPYGLLEIETGIET